MSLLGVLEFDVPIDPDDPNSGTVSTQLKKTQPAPGPPSSLAKIMLLMESGWKKGGPLSIKYNLFE